VIALPTVKLPSGFTSRASVIVPPASNARMYCRSAAVLLKAMMSSFEIGV